MGPIAVQLAPFIVQLIESLVSKILAARHPGTPPIEAVALATDAAQTAVAATTKAIQSATPPGDAMPVPATAAQVAAHVQAMPAVQAVLSQQQ